MVMDRSAGAAASALDSAARQLRMLGDGLTDAAADVRGLVALVNWQATAATVFHERAEECARGITRIEAVIDEARAAARRGSSRAAFDADLERLRG